MLLQKKFTQHFVVFVLACMLVAPATAQYVQQGSKYLGNSANPTQQGYSVAVSGDGNTVIWGAPAYGGGAWVMTRSGTAWTTPSFLFGSGGTSQQQGDSVGLSYDGNTAIVGDIGDNNAAGAAWVFTRSGTTWTQQGGKLVGTGAVNGATGAQQGSWVALSGDGNTAIIGGQGDNYQVGAAWIFTRSGSTWTQQGTKLVGSGAVGATFQGRAVALSAEGNTAIVGGPGDNSQVGAAWVFTRSGSTWTQQGAKLVGSGGVGASLQGVSVGLSADGNTAILGGQADNNNTGAAWVFTRSGSTWAQQGAKLLGTGAVGYAQQGSAVGLSGDGNIAMVSGQADGQNQTGATWMFTRSGTSWTQLGSKLVGSGSNGSSWQGWSGALSADGTTVVVGGPLDAASVGAVWVFVAGLQFYPVVPCRIMDSRGNGFTGSFGPPSLSAGSTRSVPILSSSCGIPSTARAYSLNITAVPRAQTLTFLTLWPTGQPQPLVSTLNSWDASILANAAIVPAGTGGAINVFVTDLSDLVIDINGYFAPSSASSLMFYPVMPCRVLDTRNAPGTFGGPSLTGGTPRDFPVTSSSCNIPSSSRAYSLNVTVVPKAGLGYLTAWPTGQAQPFVSTLNSLDGTVLANAAIVPAGTNGSISFYATNNTDLVVDINGYFAPPGVGGLNFYTVTPCRLVDTRNPVGPLGGPALSADQTRPFPVLQSPCGLPGSAQAYSVNVTAVPPGFLAFLALWPTGISWTGVSTLNDYKGLAVANAALLPAGSGGSVNVYVPNASDVILDLNGYFGQ